MAPRLDRAAQKAALLELGAVVAEEMRAGQGGGANAGAIGDVLATLPQASLDLVGLIGREARRRRPDPHLVAALAFICGQALEMLRFAVERSEPAAAAMLESLRGRLVAEARSDRADPAVLMLVTKQFATAKLDIGDELRGAMGDILDDQAEAAAEGASDLDMDDHLVELARELGDDAFAIHLELAETASSFPVDHRLAMASFMLASEAAPVKEAALGWLFDADPDVAPALCVALAEEAACGRVDGTTLRRLVTVRNWLRPDLRPGLDAVVRTARRRGGEPVPSTPSQVEDLRVSGFDGAGAASAFALVRTGRRYAMASLLFKLGHGVRDAWVHRDLSRAEAQAQLDRVAAGGGLVPLSGPMLRRLLSHMLTLNAAGAPPPFGAVDVVEMLDLGTVNPEAAGPAGIVAEIVGTVEVPGDADAVLADSGVWPVRYGFMHSWFEDDAGLDDLLAGRRGLSRARRVDLVLDRVVAPRRRRWGEMLAWMALLTADNDDPEEAGRFALVADALLGDRPAADVGLLRAIAENTIEARRARRG